MTTFHTAYLKRMIQRGNGMTYTKLQIAQAMEMRSEGMPWKSIARELGADSAGSISSVVHAAKHNGFIELAKSAPRMRLDKALERRTRSKYRRIAAGQAGAYDHE